MYPFLKELNENQRLAATTFKGPIQILAGAGSGKTKTIVARTANLILNKVRPSSILVLTFTNKAAKEMRDRGHKLLKEVGINIPINKMPQFTTFHSWGVFFLKQYLKNRTTKHIKKNFTIINESEQNNLIKMIVEYYCIKKIYPLIQEEYQEYKNLSLKEALNTKNFKKILKEEKYKKKLIPPIKLTDIIKLGSFLQNFLVDNSTPKNLKNDINYLLNHQTDKVQDFIKNILYVENLITNEIEFHIDFFSIIWSKYKKNLKKENKVDFDDLINIPIRILQEDTNTRENVRKYYQYIMVDEFQDTNFAQTVLLDLILNEEKNICVVGDDSQSIYGWRGAEIGFIINFAKKFNAKVINLNINYRSTKSVVGKANTLIRKAKERVKNKAELKPFNQQQGISEAILFETKGKEAEWVSKKIKSLLKKSNPSEIAVLYRNKNFYNFLEKNLIKERIPYTIIQGKNLLEKKIVQEYLSFINFFISKDNISLFNILLGSLGLLTELRFKELMNNYRLYEDKYSFYEYLQKGIYIKETTLSKKQKENLSKFINNLNKFNYSIKKLSTKDYINTFEEIIGFKKALREKIKNTSSKKIAKTIKTSIENIEMLEDLMQDYPTLEEFIENIMLDSNAEEYEKTSGKVQLMTIHASKGLEFDYVFVIGASNGIYPSYKSLEIPYLLEEERRTAYVAFTRAKKHLYITGFKKVTWDSDKTYNISKFVTEAGIKCSRS